MQNYTAGANNTPPCYILFTNEKECYCPKDFYGINCQYENSIDCTMDYRKPNSCPTFNNEFYVSDYGGDSPCNFVKKNDLTIVRFIIYISFFLS